MDDKLIYITNDDKLNKPILGVNYIRLESVSSFEEWSFMKLWVPVWFTVQCPLPPWQISRQCLP